MTRPHPAEPAPEAADHDKALMVTLHVRVDEPDTIEVSLRRYPLNAHDDEANAIEVGSVVDALAVVREWLADFEA